MVYRSKLKFLLLFEILTLVVAKASNYNYSSGARSAALANSSVTLSDTWSTFNNQAGLASISRSQASVYFENKYQIKELSVKSASIAIPTKPASFGLSVRHFGYSKYSESKIGLAVSRKFTNRFAIGMQFNYQKLHISENDNDAYTVIAEIGLMVHPTDNLSIGFHAYNPFKLISNANTYNNWPTIVRLGIGYTFGKGLLLIETEKEIDSNSILKLGLEIEIIRDFLMRCGYSSGNEQFSLGFGYTVRNIGVDIAFTQHSVLGYSPNASLMYEF